MPSENIAGGEPGYAWWYMCDSGTPTHYVYFANDGNTRSNGWSSQGSVKLPDKKDCRGGIPYGDIIKDGTKASAGNFVIPYFGRDFAVITVGRAWRRSRSMERCLA